MDALITDLEKQKEELAKRDAAKQKASENTTTKADALSKTAKNNKTEDK